MLEANQGDLDAPNLALVTTTSFGDGIISSTALACVGLSNITSSSLEYAYFLLNVFLA